MSGLAASSPTRAVAAVIAAIAALSLVFQFIATLNGPDANGSAPAALWKMARYFTVLTNAIVAVLLARVALRGRWSGPGWPAAATVWIVAVGAVYHALLAATHHPVGLEVYSNIGFHTLVPLGMLALWVFAAPKTPLTFTGPLIWTAWPLAYAVYAIGRGLTEGIYPYFFLDLDKSGPDIVSAYVAGLGVFFLLSGTLLVGAARLAGNRKAKFA